MPDPMPPAAKSQINGRLVVLTLVGLCLLGCLGTIWRYAGLHASTNEAHVELVDGHAVVVAKFSDSPSIRVGQRAVVSSRADSSERLSGIVTEMLPDSRIIIALEKESAFPPGAELSVTVETPKP